MAYGTSLQLVLEKSGISSGTPVEFIIYEKDWLGDDYMAKLNANIGSDGYVSVDWIITEAHVDAARNFLEGKLELYFEVSGIESSVLRIGFEDTGTEANCSDGIQNQNETDVDCGGECGPCPPIRDLIHWWKFEDNADDSSGSGNTGTLNGNAAYVQGAAGQGIGLDGTGDYFQAPTTGMSTFSGTISLWTKPADIPVDNTYLFAHRTGVDDNRIYLKDYAGNYDIGFGNTRDINTGYTLSPGEWTHVALTWFGASYNAYANGNLILSGSTSEPTSIASELYIGSYLGSAEYFNGVIDEVKIWKYALDSQAVQADYASVTPPGPTCDDNEQNQGETGIDCGGDFCPPCVVDPGSLEHPLTIDQHFIVPEDCVRIHFSSLLEILMTRSLFILQPA
jgi:hypothetical protein